MRTKLGALLLAVAMVCTGMPVHAEEATDVVIADVFPDYELQDYVSNNFDTNGDGSLSQDEIAGATELDLAMSWVEDVTGIEYLTELKKIDLTWTWVMDIDVTKNTKLEELVLSGAFDITELDLSNNPALKKLDVTQTSLNELDLSNNPALEELNISLSYIYDIDLSNCKELVVFNAEETDLTTVDFSNNTKLEEVNIGNTKMTSVDLSNLSELKTVKAKIASLTSIDVSKNTKLENLNLLAAKGITELDVSNNTALKTLEISGTGITELSLAANTALEELNNYAQSVSWVNYNAAPVKGLDVSNNTALKKLFLDGTDLGHMEELDLTKYPALVKVSLENTGLKAITFNDDVTYESIYLTGNELVSVEPPKNVSANAKVEFGTQARTVKVPSTDTLETFDLNSLVDITRVSVVDSDAIDYDAETGIVTFTGESKEFAYKFMLDADRVMDVTIKVEKKTVEEEAAEKEAADKAAAQPVVDKINAIGTVTLESEEAIADAREAYDALTDDQKQYVDNYELLTAAEEALEELKAEAEKPEDPEEDPEEEFDDTTDGTEDEFVDEETEETEDEEAEESTVKTGDTTAVMPYILAMAAALAVILKRKSFR